MACFIVPAVEAAVITIVRKIAESKQPLSTAKVNPETVLAHPEKKGILQKTRWLTNLLWGGSALLAFEHIWHGEVVPWFPFLTAMREPDSTTEMLHEMSTVGIGMAALVTLVWVGMVIVDLTRKPQDKQEVQS